MSFLPAEFPADDVLELTCFIFLPLISCNPSASTAASAQK